MTAAGATELPIEIRPMREADRRFVFETTVKVRWPRRNSIPWGEWLAMHGPMVEHWIREGQVRVADSGGTLLGFVVLAPTGVAMLYVKRGFRGEGIGLSLLNLTLGSVYLLRPEGGSERLSVVQALLPTPSWQRWCERRGVKWDRAAC